MKKRTKEEIQQQIKGLEAEQKTLPDINFFGEDNTAMYEAMYNILEGRKTYDDYNDREGYIESAAYRAQQWLECETEENLFVF